MSVAILTSASRSSFLAYYFYIAVYRYRTRPFFSFTKPPENRFQFIKFLIIFTNRPYLPTCLLHYTAQKAREECSRRPPGVFRERSSSSVTHLFSFVGLRDLAALCGGSGNRGVLRCGVGVIHGVWRSEEHTSELQSLMRISYAVFC